MKPWNIKRVEQKGPTCTIACAAMILGVTFDQVEKHFHPDNKRTLTTLSDYLGEHGYSILIKEVLYHTFPRFGFTELCKPFASAHILHLKQFTNSEEQHVVVMDQKGKIFDPAQENLELADFYMVTGVLGIWRYEDL